MSPCATGRSLSSFRTRPQVADGEFKVIDVFKVLRKEVGEAQEHGVTSHGSWT